jgi:nucleoside-diphosphate-sugar epimerase
MADTLNLIKETMQSDVQFITDEQRLRPKDSEVFRLKGDNSLIKELTGWQPDYSLEQGLQKTIAWFKDPENLNKYKPGVYNL